MQITIPDFSLVVLIGASGSGKSTFARKHFQPTEVVSSDCCRALISDDENDQTVTPQAFQLLRLIVALRLRKRRLTVVDATNVQPRSRLSLLRLARRGDTSSVAIVFDLPEVMCLDRNSRRPERSVPAPVIATQQRDLHRSLRRLKAEGFAAIYVLEDAEEVDNVAVIRHGAPTTPSGALRPKKRRLKILFARLLRFF